jgi:hypothetical protein
MLERLRLLSVNIEKMWDFISHKTNRDQKPFSLSEILYDYNRKD